uniref:HTH CENPB-type domain-containing protein n=1 Tax=Pelodiscus sinensis TaxID=13735 RepID=K7FGA6_PELSI
RRKFEASFKLKVVKFAKEHNNCAAARQYGVTEKMVRDWKANEDALKSMPSSKCALRRSTPHWSELEKHVADMVHEHRQNGYVVTRNKIRMFALQWGKSNPDHSKGFKATVSWCTRFMERHNLVLRQKTKIAQKLPADLNGKVSLFHRYVIQQRKKHGYALSQIGNMDETPMNFDMVGNKTVNPKGAKTVLIKTTGHEKSSFTVVLACTADGAKLRPMIIFKRKTMPKIKFPVGVFVHVNEKGWMDEGLDNVWSRRPGGLRQERSLLVWDMFRAHLTTSTKKRLARINTDAAVIPAGLTSLVQPLDVCLNKSFKDRIREQWNEWMVSGEKSFTKGGNMRVPQLDVLCNCHKSLNDIDAETVIKSFKKCGISNSLDGMEDDFLWQDEGEAKAEATPSDSELDPYDDCLTN